MIPMTSDRRKLEELYQQTGITVFYNYVTEEKSLFFNRCGATLNMMKDGEGICLHLVHTLKKMAILVWNVMC